VKAALVEEADWREAVPRAREAGAELICLPMMSFAPYPAAGLDRGGLESAERPPAGSWREALELAGDAWLAASPYESEGEGVFYLSARLGRRGDPEALLWRQRELDTRPGRYEPMFWSPGHQPPRTARLPAGRAGLLLGPELRSPERWARLAAIGTQLVIGGCAEDEEGWEQVSAAVASQAAARGMTALVVNRGPDSEPAGMAGGTLAVGPGGEHLEENEGGLIEIGGMGG
jgi:predicted amidohydrolase